MALIRWEPFKEVERLFEEELPFMPLFTTHRFPWDLAVDMYQEKGMLIAEMNLPGIDPEKIEITFQNDHLKISGTREEEKETKEKNFYCKEIKRGAFERMIRLPVEVKTEKVEAQYKKGILKVIMPLREEMKLEKVKIKVQ